MSERPPRPEARSGVWRGGLRRIGTREKKALEKAWAGLVHGLGHAHEGARGLRVRQRPLDLLELALRRRLERVVFTSRHGLHVARVCLRHGEARAHAVLFRASRSVRRAILIPQLNPGSRYR